VVLILLITAAIASSTSAQTNALLQQRFESMQERITRLDKVPEELSAIRVEINALQVGQKEQSDSIRYVILSMIGVAAAKFMEVVFGIRLSKKGGEE